MKRLRVFFLLFLSARLGVEVEGGLPRRFRETWKLSKDRDQDCVASVDLHGAKAGNSVTYCERKADVKECQELAVNSVNSKSEGKWVHQVLRFRNEETCMLLESGFNGSQPVFYGPSSTCNVDNTEGGMQMKPGVCEKAPLPSENPGSNLPERLQQAWSLETEETCDTLHLMNVSRGFVRYCDHSECDLLRVTSTEVVHRGDGVWYELAFSQNDGCIYIKTNGDQLSATGHLDHCSLDRAETELVDMQKGRCDSPKPDLPTKNSPTPPAVSTPTETRREDKTLPRSLSRQWGVVRGSDSGDEKSCFVMDLRNVTSGKMLYCGKSDRIDLQDKCKMLSVKSEVYDKSASGSQWYQLSLTQHDGCIYIEQRRGDTNSGNERVSYRTTGVTSCLAELNNLEASMTMHEDGCEKDGPGPKRSPQPTPTGNRDGDTTLPRSLVRRWSVLRKSSSNKENTCYMMDLRNVTHGFMTYCGDLGNMTSGGCRMLRVEPVAERELGWYKLFLKHHAACIYIEQKWREDATGHAKVIYRATPVTSCSSRVEELDTLRHMIEGGCEGDQETTPSATPSPMATKDEDERLPHSLRKSWRLSGSEGEACSASVDLAEAPLVKYCSWMHTDAFTMKECRMLFVTSIRTTIVSNTPLYIMHIWNEEKCMVISQELFYFPSPCEIRKMDLNFFMRMSQGECKNASLPSGNPGSELPKTLQRAWGFGERETCDMVDLRNVSAGRVSYCTSGRRDSCQRFRVDSSTRIIRTNGELIFNLGFRGMQRCMQFREESAGRFSFGGFVSYCTVQDATKVQPMHEGGCATGRPQLPSRHSPTPTPAPQSPSRYSPTPASTPEERKSERRNLPHPFLKTWKLLDSDHDHCFGSINMTEARIGHWVEYCNEIKDETSRSSRCQTLQVKSIENRGSVWHILSFHNEERCMILLGDPSTSAPSLHFGSCEIKEVDSYFRLQPGLCSTVPPPPSGNPASKLPMSLRRAWRIHRSDTCDTLNLRNASSGSVYICGTEPGKNCVVFPVDVSEVTTLANGETWYKLGFLDFDACMYMKRDTDNQFWYIGRVESCLLTDAQNRTQSPMHEGMCDKDDSPPSDGNRPAQTPTPTKNALFPKMPSSLIRLWGLVPGSSESKDQSCYAMDLRNASNGFIRYCGTFDTVNTHDGCRAFRIEFSVVDEPGGPFELYRLQLKGYERCIYIQKKRNMYLTTGVESCSKFDTAEDLMTMKDGGCPAEGRPTHSPEIPLPIPTTAVRPSPSSAVPTPADKLSQLSSIWKTLNTTVCSSLDLTDLPRTLENCSFVNLPNGADRLECDERTIEDVDQRILGETKWYRVVPSSDQPNGKVSTCVFLRKEHGVLQVARLDCNWEGPPPTKASKMMMRGACRQDEQPVTSPTPAPPSGHLPPSLKSHWRLPAHGDTITCQSIDLTHSPKRISACAFGSARWLRQDPCDHYAVT
eukprot:gb/GECG01014871.1/.p1 GENE.gb/GECG01014871.1/~~gb/GECG01014871.1/.p1  ORF type:complete len:1446 (+),score=138.79 gb/GECG01014871.1/:1-4338(+)